MKIIRKFGILLGNGLIVAIILYPLIHELGHGLNSIEIRNSIPTFFLKNTEFKISHYAHKRAPGFFVLELFYNKRRKFDKNK